MKLSTIYRYLFPMVASGQALLLPPAAAAQAATKQTMLIFSPKVSYSLGIPLDTYKSLSGKYQFEADTQQEYDIVYPDGQIKKISPSRPRFGADIGVKKLDLVRHQAWSVMAGADWGSELHPSKGTFEATYKGHTANGWHPLYTYGQLKGAVTYYWLNASNAEGFFARAGVERMFKLSQDKFPGVSPAQSYPISYVENGKGDLVTLSSYQANSFSISPEVGYLYKFIELSVSATVPVTRTLVERHTLYENSQVVGEHEIGYRLGGAFVNCRLVLSALLPKANRNKPVVPAVPANMPAVAEKKYLIGETIKLNNVYFTQGTAELLPSSATAIQDLARQLQAHATMRIRLEGHTDIIGSAAENQRLSEKRVAAIKAALVASGVRAERIEVKGYGAKKPLHTACPPPTGCPENRRVEFVVINN